MPVTILNTGIFNPSTGDTAHAGVAAADATAFVCTTTQTIVAGVASASAVSLQPGGNYSTGTARATAAAVPAIIGTLASAGVASASTNGQQPWGASGTGVAAGATNGQQPVADISVLPASGLANGFTFNAEAAAGPAYLLATSSGSLSGSTVVSDIIVSAPAGKPVVVVVASNETGQSVTVSDSQSSTWTQQESITSSVATFMFTAYPASGYSTSDTITVTFGTVAGQYAVLAVSCPSSGAVDQAGIAGGNTATPSEGVTTISNGETAVAAFVWNAAGGVGTVSSPFTELTQFQVLTNFHIAVAFDAQTSAGALTAAYSIASTVWRAGVVTFTPHSATLASANVATATVYSAINAPSGVTRASAGIATASTAGQAATTNSGTPGYVGVSVSPSLQGQSSYAASWTAWSSSSITNRPLQVVRYYFTGLPPSSINADMTAAVSAGLKVCMSFNPAYNPPASGDLSTMTSFLSSCSSAGLVAEVNLYHEPTNKMTAAQFITMWQYYAPSIRAYYPMTFVSSSYQVYNSSSNTYWPGDAYVDNVATDYYAGDYYDSYNERLDTIIGGLADGTVSPRIGGAPLPFGIWEFNSSTSNQSTTETNTFFQYMQTYFSGRLAAGMSNADLLLFSYNGTLSTPPITASSDIRVPLYQGLYDALNGQVPA